MAIHSQTFAIITSRLIVKCWKKWIIPTKFEKNRTKPGNPYYLVLFENRTKPGTVLSGDSLYLFFMCCQCKQQYSILLMFELAIINFLCVTVEPVLVWTQMELYLSKKETGSLTDLSCPHLKKSEVRWISANYNTNLTLLPPPEGNKTPRSFKVRIGIW